MRIETRTELKSQVTALCRSSIYQEPRHPAPAYTFHNPTQFCQSLHTNRNFIPHSPCFTVRVRAVRSGAHPTYPVRRPPPGYCPRCGFRSDAERSPAGRLVVCAYCLDGVAFHFSNPFRIPGGRGPPHAGRGGSAAVFKSEMGAPPGAMPMRNERGHPHQRSEPACPARTSVQRRASPGVTEPSNRAPEPPCGLKAICTTAPGYLRGAELRTRGRALEDELHLQLTHRSSLSSEAAGRSHRWRSLASLAAPPLPGALNGRLDGT